MVQLKATVIAVCAASVSSLCPFGFGNDAKPSDAGKLFLEEPPYTPPTEPQPGYEDAMNSLDVDAVQADIKKLLTDSQEFWPADYGNYGPLFVRLAWHCSGTYRSADGRGGCTGGRQRFEPELSWEDNTNLDKARRLLGPIKEKYGLGLSWGDLFTLAGTTSIESMGGPTLGVCLGRVDDEDGAKSDILGPTPLQEKLSPCTTPGDCGAPLGTTTVGLIYVNPEGPMGVPEPKESALEVRDTFARMGMDDRETVALIGGGHSFGKTHGACPDRPGLSPNETKELGLNPDTQAWQGHCKSGKGADSFTSGFEGPWTSNPTMWDNDYFKNLVDYDWEVHQGPAGHMQWRIKDEARRKKWNALAPGPQGGVQKIMMLTSDIALKRDDKYWPIVQEFATDQAALDKAFAAAWHKLTTRAFGTQTNPRCLTPTKKTALRLGSSKRVETVCETDGYF